MDTNGLLALERQVCVQVNSDESRLSTCDWIVKVHLNTRCKDFFRFVAQQYVTRIVLVQRLKMCDDFPNFSTPTFDLSCCQTAALTKLVLIIT